MKIIRDKVKVFKDIKNNRWTIYNYETGKHIGYRKSLYLKDTKFEVLEYKRRHILKTRKRFPHAWIIGYLTKSDSKKLSSQINYHPFTDKYFKTNSSKKVVSRLLVFFRNDGKVFSR